MAYSAIIADDLTGASDTGIKFLTNGYKTTVIIDYKSMPVKMGVDIIAINTNTRELEGDAAYAIVKETFLKLKNMGYKNFYKKIDSLFRGNIGKELDAMMDALNYDLALIIPAIPSNDREILDGYLNIGFMEDGSKKMIQQMHIPTFLQTQTDKKIGLIDLETIRSSMDDLNKRFEALCSEKEIIIFDTQTEGDLVILSVFCKQLDRKFALVGTSGIANYIPEIWKLNNIFETKKRKMTLLVAGSFNNETSTQIKHILEYQEVLLIKVNTSTIIEEGQSIEIENIIAQAKKIFEEKTNVELVVIAVDTLFDEKVIVNSKNAEVIANTVAETAKLLMEYRCFDKLILTGGDTASRVFNKIGSSEIKLLDEIIPGIPVGKIVSGQANGAIVVTKSGAFGKPDTFVKVMEYLKEKKEWLECS